jgi:hypothetical protein
LDVSFFLDEGIENIAASLLVKVLRRNAALYNQRKGPAGAHRDRLGILPAGEHVALSGYSLTGRFI